MELRFNNGKISVIDATREDLCGLSNFIFGTDNVPTVAPVVKTEVKKEIVKEETPVIKKVEDIPAPVVEVPDDYMTLKQLAEHFGTFHQTLDYRYRTHGIPYVLRDNTKYFRLKDFEEDFKKCPLKNGNNKVKKEEKPKTSFAIWKQAQSKKCVNARRDIGKTFSLVFTEMTNVYGINWEQVKKDFYKDNGSLCHSTIQLCYYLQYEQKHSDNEHYENLFENQLDKILAA